MNPVAKAVASILFDLEKREQTFQKDGKLKKHLAAAETTVDYLEKVVQQTGREKFRQRVNPGLLYKELEISSLGLNQRGYVCIFQAVLSCPGLNLDIDTSRSGSGCSVYRFDLGPYVISYLKRKMGMYEQPQPKL